MSAHFGKPNLAIIRAGLAQSKLRVSRELSSWISPRSYAGPRLTCLERTLIGTALIGKRAPTSDACHSRFAQAQVRSRANRIDELTSFVQTRLR
jgi:hypothetical protein